MTTEVCSGDQVISLGRVHKPVGLQGLLRITSTGEILSSLNPGSTLSFYHCKEFRYGLLLKSKRVTTARLKEIKKTQSPSVDIFLEDISKRVELEKLKGLFIGLKMEDLKSTIHVNEEPYLFEYLCCEVKDVHSKKIYGKIIQIENSVGQDLLSVQGNLGVFLLPLSSNYFHSFSRKESTFYTENLDEYIAEVQMF